MNIEATYGIYDSHTGGRRNTMIHGQPKPSASVMRYFGMKTPMIVCAKKRLPLSSHEAPMPVRSVSRS
jgi:hypothetical protein